MPASFLFLRRLRVRANWMTMSPARSLVATSCRTTARLSLTGHSAVVPLHSPEDPNHDQSIAASTLQPEPADYAGGNRMVFYDGTMLHSSDIPAAGKLSDDPQRGRLTLNGCYTCRRKAVRSPSGEVRGSCWPRRMAVAAGCRIVRDLVAGRSIAFRCRHRVSHGLVKRQKRARLGVGLEGNHVFGAVIKVALSWRLPGHRYGWSFQPRYWHEAGRENVA